MRKKRYPAAGAALLLAASAGFLLLSTVGSTRAALTYNSENYEMRVNVSNIDVTLLEDGKSAEGEGGLLSGRFGDGENQEKLVPGKHYEELLSVQNSGAVDSYVRVIVYRSWKDGSAGEKDRTLSPELIGLGLNTDDWILDQGASASEDQFRERLVLYYRKPLPPGEVTTPFIKELWLDSSIYEAVDQKAEDGTYTTSFRYDTYCFDLEAEAQVVQAFDGEGAVGSAWGVSVSIAEDGTLSLVR